MKTKLIIFSLIVAGICTMSCRQDEESLTEETLQSSLKEQNPEIESQRNSHDSLVVESMETEPPKTGTHWKVDETSGVKKNDSLSLLLQVESDNEPQNPPKTGTHWKEK